MDIKYQEQSIIKQLASYIEVKDIISYCHAFPDELEKTAKEDYQKGLITMDEFNDILKKVEKIKNKEEIEKCG